MLVEPKVFTIEPSNFMVLSDQLKVPASLIRFLKTMHAIASNWLRTKLGGEKKKKNKQMNQLHDNLLLQGDPHSSFPPYMSDANDKSLID